MPVESLDFNTLAYSSSAMKAIGLTFKGMEDIASQEVKELIGKKAEVNNSFVCFESDEEEICRLCYLGQSFRKILGVVCEVDTKGFDENKIAAMIKSASLENWLAKDKSFAARAILLADIDIERSELEAFIGEQIIENAKNNLGFSPKVNLSEPDITFVGVINKKTFYLCIDFSGADLSKRDYRIFAHPSAIKSAIAYAMLKIADINENEIILDPMCGSGTIAIEAVHLLSRKSVNFFTKDKFAFSKFMEFDFDKEDSKTAKKCKAEIHAFDKQMRHIKTAEKNAKIAAVNNLINFSRIDVEWLDTKFEKHSVDKIVSYPPQIGKSVSTRELEKIFKELFYQAKYILAPKGKIILLSTEGRIDNLLAKAAKMHDFSVVSKRDIMHGKQKEVVLLFEKKK
jgi:23S rRNA G2445 N2-methylase RlmL